MRSLPSAAWPATVALLQNEYLGEARTGARKQRCPKALCYTYTKWKTRLNGFAIWSETITGDMSASGRICAGWSAPCCCARTQSRHFRTWCPAQPTAQPRCGCKRQLVLASAVRVYCKIFESYLPWHILTHGFPPPGTSSFGKAEGQRNHVQTATGPCSQSLCCSRVLAYQGELLNEVSVHACYFRSVWHHQKCRQIPQSSRR